MTTEDKPLYELTCRKCEKTFQHVFWDDRTGESGYIVCPHCGNDDQTETLCRVCGYDNEYPMWDKNGNAWNDICPACGNETGVDDYDLKTIRESRQRWGRQWWSSPWSTPPGLPKAEYRPENWDPEEQLKHIPSQFL